MKIYIRSWEGAMAELEVDASDTVRTVKAIIVDNFLSCSAFRKSAFSSVPPFWLYYRGVDLENDRILSDHNIGPGAWILIRPGPLARGPTGPRDFI